MLQYLKGGVFLNKRLYELRRIKKLSQKEFGEGINLSQNHISSIEKGVRNITPRILDDICRVYNVNKDWLIDGKGEMFDNTLDSYNIEDEEIKEFMEMYLQLDDETKGYIQGLISKALKK